MARILMIAYTTYVHDGRVKRHAQALAQRGDQIDVICLENPETGTREGVNVIGLRMPRYRGSSRLNYFRTYLRFFTAAALKSFRMSLVRPYDVVIICTMPDAAVLCAIPARLFGARVLLDIHDTMPELYAEKFGGRRGALGARLLQIEERVSASAADRVLAVHELHRQRLISAGVKPDKIGVVLNMPDQRIFACRADPCAASNEFTLVCHGTIARRLGLDIAIHAMDLLHDRFPTVRLLIIGSGDYLTQVKVMVQSRKLGDCVRFMDPVPLERLPEVLSTATVGLVPNRTSGATELMLPVKLLEYAALGIPVIAARLKTIEHYFQTSVCFFRPDDAADLARAIEELYRDAAYRRKLALCAKSAVDAINWQKQRRNYYAVVDSLLPSSGRPAQHQHAPRLAEQRPLDERRIEVD